MLPVDSVIAHARAAEFLLGKQLGRLPPTDVVERRLDLGDRLVTTDVYRPAGRARTRSTIFLMHGLTAHGYRDPRITEFCRLLTTFGCTVVTPHFDEVAAFSTDHVLGAGLVERTVLAITEDFDLKPPGGRVGVLTTSYSCLFCLIAASRPSVRDRISAVCLIGGMYSAQGCQHVLSGQDGNHYARWVLFLNYGHVALGKRPGLERALRTGLEDNSWRRALPQLPQVLTEIAPEDRELFERLTRDRDFRVATYAPSLAWMAEQWVPAFSRIGEIACPVVLMHGRDDSVIPASETMEMAARLQREGVADVHVEVSPLIAHMEAIPIGPRLLPQVGRLVHGFARFFEAAAS